MSTKLDRDFVAADLAAVEQLLGKLTGRDVFARRSLESRREHLRNELATLAEDRGTLASASLFFSGEPVLANRGIEASFGAQAMEKFQDVVTKIFALQHTGALGQRGIVPGKDDSKLHITNVVRGSFGFRLEEMTPQTNLVTSPLKEAVDEAARLMERFGTEDEEAFEAEAENLDGRVLASVKEFFDALNSHRATFRLVSGNTDKSFRAQNISRAAERANITTVGEDQVDMPGQLSGALRDCRIFEFRPEDGRPAIKGAISPEVAPEKITEINHEFSDKDSIATFQVKSVRQNDKVLRERFTLLAIRPK